MSHKVKDPKVAACYLLDWSFKMSKTSYTELAHPGLGLFYNSLVLVEPVWLWSDVESRVSEFPPPRSDFKEEEKEHEEEARADVQDHTKTHVHAVKP